MTKVKNYIFLLITVTQMCVSSNDIFKVKIIHSSFSSTINYILQAIIIDFSGLPNICDRAVQRGAIQSRHFDEHWFC